MNEVACRPFSFSPPLQWAVTSIDATKPMPNHSCSCSTWFHVHYCLIPIIFKQISETPFTCNLKFQCQQPSSSYIAVISSSLFGLIGIHIVCVVCVWIGRWNTMGRARGVSSGGGQSSLGYLFGSTEENTTTPRAVAVENPKPAEEPTKMVVAPPPQSQPLPDAQAPRNINNYHRAEGQNTGNFITGRPSTKVHAAPGGGSSLGYLFGGQKWKTHRQIQICLSLFYMVRTLVL